ncbi:MAG: hypothetical protein WAV76_05490, partial [Bacteroidota bacterium]
LIVERGMDALDGLPKNIRQSKEATAETIENNVRRVIIDEQPVNPKYYEKMSKLLDALIRERRQQKIEYEQYLAKIIDLTKKIKNPAGGTDYPTSLNTNAKRALTIISKRMNVLQMQCMMRLFPIKKMNSDHIRSN